MEKNELKEKKWIYLKGYNINFVYKLNEIIDGFEWVERVYFVFNK